MSYILDALRKADAERERDPARGIHAQPAAVPQAAAARGAGWRWPLVAIGGLALAAVATAAWWRATPPPAPVVAVATPAPVVGMPALDAGARPAAEATPMPGPPPATEVHPPAPPLPAPVVAKAMPTPPGPGAPTAPGVMAPTAPSPMTAAPAGPVAAPAAPAPPAAATDRILSVAELPPDVVRDLPKLTIGGGVYSDNRAQRMLIVGGQVVGEGAELAPGLRLEEIRNKSAVLRFRGLRYSVGY